MSSKTESEADIVYHGCLKGTSYGHAIYKQVSSEALKPETVGYFDIDSDWQPIIQLAIAQCF
jgi:hypothetical protein